MYLLFYCLWIIFNANLTLELALIGLIVAGVLFAFVCKFMDYSIKKELSAYKHIGLFLTYVAHLVVDVVKANFATMKLILTQKEEVEPVIASFQSDLKTPLGQTMLANAITLTPGTITVDVTKEGTYRVHCLDKEFADGLQNSVYEALGQKLEQEEENHAN